MAMILLSGMKASAAVDKVVMDQTLEAVLTGKLQNDNEQIKNWFLHDFQRDE